MSTYLLLRNNKESGPYTLDGLVNFGLKPYDLVWIEGKSAAWRYSSEVAELKPYAPDVEEQPFDRFFKKNTEEKKAEPPATREKPVIQEKAGIEERYQKYIPKKSVVVTLPGQRTVAVQKPAVPESPLSVVPTITVTENPAAAQIKYSQPLDEIKEMYVKTLQQRKSKIARKSGLIKDLKRASVIVGLIALGIFAGFVMKSGSGKKDTISQQLISSSSAITREPVQQLPDKPVQQENTPVNILPPEEVQQLQSEVTPKVKEPQKEKVQPSQTEIRKETTVLVENKKKDIDEKENVAADVKTNPVAGERTRKVRDNNNTGEKEKPVVKSRKTGIESLVSVTGNDYKRVAFGGIRNLELTVTNDSKYVLDKVIVELQYLKPSEEPLRTEMIEFHSVAPNGAITKRIPDTNRGIKVLYKIINVQSSQPETALTGF